MSGSAVAARERARAAKARMDADRKARDASIEAAQTRFFLAALERQQALQRAEQARERMAAAVRELTTSPLQLSAETAAALCELSVREARAMRRRGDPPRAAERLRTGDGTDTGDAQPADAGEGPPAPSTPAPQPPTCPQP